MAALADVPADVGLAEEAGGLLSRGAKWLGGLFGAKASTSLTDKAGNSLTSKVGTSLAAHDIAQRMEGNNGGVQHPEFGTPGYDGIPANLSSSQFGGL